MPRVSVNILTKNRAELLKKALASVLMQSFKDFQIVVVDDGSTDNTEATLQNLKIENLKIVSHRQSSGITKSRQEALEKSEGEYIAILDDDDEWLDKDKLKKQLDYFEQHPKAVLVGGGIKTKNEDFKLKSQSDIQIRQTMLFRNNFYTSTIMFK
ncbi:MAG TPA: glycosyltransferase family A protein, partial [Candidatus Limnocylindria bacterium]|nr:glycosyltransferase family A protein [Candidatus Limnocylindria bacterium]